jgi:hypothetical protein
MNIYTCNLHFPFTTHYISITLIAYSFEEARIKFISKCLEKYYEIKKIDFEALCPTLCERDSYKNTLQINTPKDLEEYLEENVNRDTIECLNACSFKIKYEYD